MGETKVKTATTKEGKKVEWRHPGGKFRRLGPAYGSGNLQTVMLACQRIEV